MIFFSLLFYFFKFRCCSQHCSIVFLRIFKPHLSPPLLPDKWSIAPISNDDKLRDGGKLNSLYIFKIFLLFFILFSKFIYFLQHCSNMLLRIFKLHLPPHCCSEGGQSSSLATTTSSKASGLNNSLCAFTNFLLLFLCLDAACSTTQWCF
jgi:hypothetical protein